MKGLHILAFILLIIGGLNWLLVGLFGWDISTYLPGGMQGGISKTIYVLVGLAAISEIVTHKSNCKRCGSAATGAM